MPDVTKQAVVVYGSLRSGTTLLRLMLDGNPVLACPGETDFMFDHLPTKGQAYDIGKLEQDRIYRAHAEKYAGVPLGSLTPDGMIEQIANPDRIAVLMLHRHLDRLLTLYPNMRIIHLVRDPRDVARSSIRMGWAGTVYNGIDHWIDTEETWTRIEPRLSPNQALRVQYEDLIRDTQTTLSTICDFCATPYVPAMMNYADTSTYSKPDPTLIDQWKLKQTPREIGLVEHKIGALLASTGYAPSGHPVSGPTQSEALSLWLRNKYSIWAHRIKRYGVSDPLIISLSNRLGQPKIAQKARRRMDDKLVKYLK